MVQHARRKLYPIAQGKPQSPTAEAFRTIRTNLQFTSIKNQTKVILFTSSHAGEGKTSTVCNLGVTIAQTGKRVLIIDADLRKPTIHQWFAVSNLSGLSNYLIEQKQLEEYILPSPEVSNLFILPSGDVPPNPSELLESNEFSQLLKTCKEDYDVILIDSTPVLAVTDSLVVSQAADGTVFVVNSRKTSHFQARRGIDALIQVNARMLGVILNRVSVANEVYEY